MAIGKVAGAGAYLSQDQGKRLLRVSDTSGGGAHKHLPLPVLSGNTITIERGGGRIRQASGKEILRGSIGKPMPRIGRRYVFFLKSHEETQSFSIITGYELRGGKIFPLDGSSRFKEEMMIREYAEYDRYAGASEEALLTEIREAINITLPSNNGMQRTRP